MNRIKTRLAVLADPHFYASELGTEGPAFEEYLRMDTKVLRRSEELFDEALALVQSHEPEVLLIPGDLTKDGEHVSHTRLAEKLVEVQKGGIRVYVLPGNHDLNNPWASSYAAGAAAGVKNMSPDNFLSLYGPFGYDGAVLRDSRSLSYVAQPVPGLWILALDVCNYEDNNSKPAASGRLKSETAAWALEALDRAGKEDQTVIGLIHHNLLEHHRFQSLVMGDFILADWQDTSRRLAEAGLRIVFTGHYHAQDVALARFDDNCFIFDVETGSTVTFPCPIRMVDLEGPILKIRTLSLLQASERAKSIAEEAVEALKRGIWTRAVSLMRRREVEPAAILKLAPHVVDAYIAHTVGDEKLGPKERASIEGLFGGGHPSLRRVGQYLEALWTNDPPPDNNLTVDLRDGSFA